MVLKGKRITLGITGPLYAVNKVIPQIQNLIKEGADIIPIMSVNYYMTKNEGKRVIQNIENITCKKVKHTINDVEKVCGKKATDIMIIAPCSGNSIAKIANGIVDNPILVAVSMHLKNQKNIVVGIATTEGLGLEAENIGKLLNMKHIFFVPFRQDNPITKPNSLMYSSRYVLDTTINALNGEQIQPILL